MVTILFSRLAPLIYSMKTSLEVSQVRLDLLLQREMRPSSFMRIFACAPEQMRLVKTYLILLKYGRAEGISLETH